MCPLFFSHGCFFFFNLVLLWNWTFAQNMSRNKTRCMYILHHSKIRVFKHSTTVQSTYVRMFFYRYSKLLVAAHRLCFFHADRYRDSTVHCYYMQRSIPMLKRRHCCTNLLVPTSPWWNVDVASCMTSGSSYHKAHQKKLLLLLLFLLLLLLLPLSKFKDAFVIEPLLLLLIFFFSPPLP